MEPEDILNNEDLLYQAFIKLQEGDVSMIAGFDEEQLNQARAEFLRFNEQDEQQANYHATHFSQAKITVPAPTDDDPNATAETVAVNGYAGAIYPGTWTSQYANGQYTSDGNYQADYQYRDLGGYGDAIESAAQAVLAGGDARGIKAELGEDIEDISSINARSINAAIDHLITGPVSDAGPAVETDVEVAAIPDVKPPTIA